MMFKIVVALVAVTTVYGSVLDRDTQAAWEAHSQQHGVPANDVHAQANFAATHQRIQAHNNDPTQTYKQGHNKFSHLNDTQKNAYKGAKKPNTQGARFAHPAEMRTIPASLDLRTNKCLQAIKDQGVCGDCYAFSAVSVVEFDYCIKHGTPVSLSEQQVTDCSSAYGNYGCNGGWQANVWQYVAAKGGLDTQASYPFTSGTTGKAGTCKFNAANVAGTVSTSAPYTYLTANSASLIKNVLANNGLVAVAINANTNFMHYTSGVFSASASSCDPAAINHAVTIVGYGTLNNIPYWIVRNSWGSRWGASGYILMQSGVNTCGIESYPMITTSG